MSGPCALVPISLLPSDLSVRGWVLLCAAEDELKPFSHLLFVDLTQTASLSLLGQALKHLVSTLQRYQNL